MTICWDLCPMSAKQQLAFAWMWHLFNYLKLPEYQVFLDYFSSSIQFYSLKSVFIDFYKMIRVKWLMINISQTLFWRWIIISIKIGFNTNPETQQQSSIYLSKMKHQNCVTQGMSRNLTDIPWVTQFLALKSCVTKGKLVTQGMSVRFRDIPWVTQFWCFILDR